MDVKAIIGPFGGDLADVLTADIEPDQGAEVAALVDPQAATGIHLHDVGRLPLAGLLV